MQNVNQLRRAWGNVTWLVVYGVQRVTRTEWSENWRAWPHCCTQAGCWMHYSEEGAWCRCTCRWCRWARWNFIDWVSRQITRGIDDRVR